MFNTDYDSSGHYTAGRTEADLMAELAELDRFAPTSALAVRLLVSECLDWLASGAHADGPPTETAAGLARTLAADIARDGPGVCVPMQCADRGTDKCAGCAFNASRSNRERFRNRCQLAVDSYRWRKQQAFSGR